MQQTTLEISSVQEIIENCIIRTNSILSKWLANGNIRAVTLKPEYARSILLGDIKKLLFKGESTHDFNKLSKNVQVFLNDKTKLIDNIICHGIEVEYCYNKQLITDVIDAFNTIPCENLQDPDSIDQIIKALTNRINSPIYNKPANNLPIVVKAPIDVETFCCKSKKKN